MGDELIICTIDGNEVFCEEGTTILEAAKSCGIEIPALCHHPYLSVSGACRICVVEIEGDNLLYPACSTPVATNMVIYTTSEKVKQARRIVLEMYLSNHFGDCLTCDASGDCLLEKYSYDFGATGKLYEKNEFDPEKNSIDDKNPFIILDRGKCILCGRCIRACEEWVHCDALTFINKGHRMVVSTLYDQGLEENKECIFCGNCINVCPVGALAEKSAIRQGRFSEVKKTKTTCPYCGVGCGLEIYTKDEKIIKVRGDDDSPVSKGRLCIKGKFGLDFVNSEKRLTKPLMRDSNGELREVEQIQALLAIKEKIDEVKAKGGGLAGLASAKCTNEENFVFQKFVRTVLGSDNVDHCARICHAPSVAGLKMTLGSGAMTNPIDDIEGIDLFFIIGSNMTSSHPVISWKVMNRINEGAMLILIDPKKSRLSRYATMQLQINPGSDMALIYAMIKMIREEHMHDTDFLESRCEGVEEFFAELDKLDLDELVAMTGIDEIDVRLAARLYAISSSSSIYYAMGITQHVFGTGNVTALADLALTCGKVGNGFTGINPLRGQNNVQGACDMGALAGSLPGYRDITNENDRRFFEEKWGQSLPEKPGLTLTEIISGADKGEIDFLYIMGENPVLSDPDAESVIRALKKTNFLVVQDIFLTETARLADIVLPAPSFAEKDGTFTNTERRVQRVRKVLDPPSTDIVDDWKTLQQIAEMTGLEWNYSSWTDIFEEMRQCAPIYSHIEPAKIGEIDYSWPHDEHGKSVKRLHQEQFTRGKGRLIFHDVNQPYRTSEEYPYLLIIGRIYEHFHTGTMTRKSKGIEHLQPKSRVYLNPRDAVKLKVTDGDRLIITSETGTIEAYCGLSLDVRRGQAFMSFHYKESVANRLTSKKKLDPLSKMAAMKVTPVQIVPLKD